MLERVCAIHDVPLSFRIQAQGSVGEIVECPAGHRTVAWAIRPADMRGVVYGYGHTELSGRVLAEALRPGGKVPLCVLSRGDDFRTDTGTEGTLWSPYERKRVWRVRNKRVGSVLHSADNSRPECGPDCVIHKLTVPVREQAWLRDFGTVSVILQGERIGAEAWMSPWRMVTPLGTRSPNVRYRHERDQIEPEEWAEAS